MRSACPIHIEACIRGLHVIFKWGAYIAGDINCLNFDRTKIYYLASVIIRHQNNIYVASGLAVFIIKANFNQRSPFCIGREEKSGGIVGNNPILTKANRASDRHTVSVIYATNTQGVVSLIFCAVRNFVVEWTEPFFTVADCLWGLVVYRIPEYFSKRLLWHVVSFN